MENQNTERSERTAAQIKTHGYSQQLSSQLRVLSFLLLHSEGVLLFSSFTHDWTNVMSPGASETSHPRCRVTDTGAFYGFKGSATGRVKLLFL